MLGLAVVLNLGLAVTFDFGASGLVLGLLHKSCVLVLAVILDFGACCSSAFWGCCNLGFWGFLVSPGFGGFLVILDFGACCNSVFLGLPLFLVRTIHAQPLITFFGALFLQACHRLGKASLICICPHNTFQRWRMRKHSKSSP